MYFTKKNCEKTIESVANIRGSIRRRVSLSDDGDSEEEDSTQDNNPPRMDLTEEIVEVLESEGGEGTTTEGGEGTTTELGEGTTTEGGEGTTTEGGDCRETDDPGYSEWVNTSDTCNCKPGSEFNTHPNGTLKRCVRMCPPSPNNDSNYSDWVPQTNSCKCWEGTKSYRIINSNRESVKRCGPE
tara:strand:+ start:2409 stop:2960 length:552 start_codon:yes stop_codon:yes gene_type:complete